MRLFDFTLKQSGFNIAKAKRVFAEICALSESDHRQYLENRKAYIVNHHITHNPFYRSFAKSADIRQWNTIPVMTKNDLQQPLENRLSNGFGKKTVYVNKTSGSSGHPFVFAKDKWCHALTWAEIMNRFSWYDIDLNHSKQARFYGIPLDKTGYLKERLKDILSNRYRFSIFDLSDSAFNKALQKFRTTPFDYINGYTSSIVQFAKYLKRQNITLKSECPSLKVCIVTAEMLYEDDRALLEIQFGIPVVNEYGASELGLIAFQNTQNEWQVNSETLLVEILDENNMPVPHGQHGRVVITALYNEAHPFIRYDLGDIGSLAEHSTTYKPVFKDLIGRTNDIALLPSGKKAAGLTFYYITKSVIEDDGNVSEFIIEQLALDHFKITYVSNAELTDAKVRLIRNELYRYLEPGIRVSFNRVLKLERQKSGKLKQFISYLST